MRRARRPMGQQRRPCRSLSWSILAGVSEGLTLLRRGTGRDAQRPINMLQPRADGPFRGHADPALQVGRLARAVTARIA